MIVDKRIIQDINAPSQVTPSLNVDVGVKDDRYMTEAEAVAGNALADLYTAVANIIKSIPSDPDNPNSEPLFKTVKWNMGQLNRVRNSKHNDEYALAFPACFIHFVNVYWNLGFNKVGQAYADMRICYVLNRLNTEDEEYQTEGVQVFKRIIEAIEDNMSTKLAPLTTRFQLSYWDQVESFDHGLQQFWITYEVRCNDYTTYRYRKYIPAYLVAPPFTNFSDMKPENNTEDRENVVRQPEDATGITTQVPPPPEETKPDGNQ